MRDKDFDVVIAGSGAAGLTAALAAATHGRRTLVIESASELGGTTALSGGRVWIPVNGRPENAGDSADAANQYLDQIFDTRYQPMIRTFVREAAAMAEFVEKQSPHRFVVCPNYPDYHQDRAGATRGGRCFDVAPIDLGELVPQARSVRQPPGYTPITHAEWEKWRYPANIDTEALTARMAAGIRTGGVGLTAALLDGAVRAGATVRTNTELTAVLTGDAGVTGVRVRTAEGEQTIRTTSVVLATGAFDASDELRKRLLPAGLGVSASAPGNTGIALTVAENLGLAVDNLTEGWWMPMAQLDDDTVDGTPYPRGLVRERGVPRQIVVNRHGHRFLDEALPYNEFGKAMHRTGPDGTPAGNGAHLIFDQGFRDRYPLPGLPATGDVPSHVVTAPDLATLAGRIGVEQHCLAETVERWNGFCADGVDHDFGRGENAYDRYYGDPWQKGNPCLGPIDRPPYYAMRVQSGVIGSKGGPVTDTAGRVLTRDGAVLPGLYAVGNAAAFWTGDGYPGPGATLAVGMTFGYLAGLDITEH
ncbi:3-oxosteroid 1-dehydrogenase [Amycolatopsis pretoriensis]|uniref:3-oxosteroid 1-dehydrogenase n=1 Tax=Amycolatopsis pretoriensis TaxID=218821 RepID=A0A1H5R1T3_9PSEU|nr:FAD-dependent oxidoreductase [Amycolatopsis pretoriensis]SEF32279.1 3-oxosteroid 1-dehydrogenase [Amycolatopsis pretoriensis]